MEELVPDTARLMVKSFEPEVKLKVEVIAPSGYRKIIDNGGDFTFWEVIPEEDEIVGVKRMRKREH